MPKQPLSESANQAFWQEMGTPQRAIAAYTASVAVRLAISVLWLAHRLYRTKTLDLAGVEFAVRLSEKLRQFSWHLVRWARGGET